METNPILEAIEFISETDQKLADYRTNKDENQQRIETIILMESSILSPRATQSAPAVAVSQTDDEKEADRALLKSMFPKLATVIGSISERTAGGGIFPL